MPYTDYLNLQINSKLVFSDSGTINEEADLLKFKAINIRENHERHEAMSKGSTLMSGLNFDDLLQQQLEEYQQDNGYGDGKEPENDLENEADETDGYDN